MSKVKILYLDPKTVLLMGAALFLLPFGFYFATLCPTVYGGDSGELTAAAYTLGIAHIPGHPLYVLVGKLFSYLPFGNVAYRLNFMSAFFAALSAAGLFAFLVNFAKGIKLERISGFDFYFSVSLAVLVFASSKTFWHYAVVAETYTLSIFFLAALMILLVRFEQTKNASFLYAFSFVYGLSLTNTLSGVLLLPALLYWFFFRKVQILNVKQTVISIVCAFTGFLVYLFVPFRMMFSEPVLHFGNPKTWGKFLDNLTGGAYRNALVDLDLGRLARRFEYSFTWLVDEFQPLFFIPMALGAFALFKQQRRFFLFTLIATITILWGTVKAFGFDLSIDKKSYYLPVYFLTATWLAAGFWFVFSNTVKKLNIAIQMLAIGCLALQTFNHFKASDQHDNYLFEDIAKNALQHVAPNAVVFLDGEWLTFPMIYLKTVEHFRPDVDFYDRSNNVFKSFYQFSTEELKIVLSERDKQEEAYIRSGERPVYFTKFRTLKTADKFKLIPEGLLFRASESDKPSAHPFDQYAIRGISESRFEQDATSKRILTHYYLMKGENHFALGETKEAKAALGRAEALVEDNYEQFDILAYFYLRHNSVDEALRIFKKELVLFPYYAPTYKNIGILYFDHFKDFERALPFFERYVELSPNAYDYDFFVRLIHSGGRLNEGAAA